MNTTSSQSVRPEVNDPNKISTVYQVLYIGPAEYEGTQSEKHELTRALRTFQSLQANNSQIVKIRPSFLLGLFLVWTKTRQAAENLIWSFDGYERRYEVVELQYDARSNDYVRSANQKLSDFIA